MIEAIAAHVLMESGEAAAAVTRLEAALPRYPNKLQLVYDYPDALLKAGRPAQASAFAEAQLQRFPQNVYAQLNYTLVTNGVIEYITRNVGDDHVLFGTDAPMRDPRPQAGWLAFTRLPEASKRRIFGANFAGILKRAFR